MTTASDNGMVDSPYSVGFCSICGETATIASKIDYIGARNCGRRHIGNSTEVSYDSFKAYRVQVCTKCMAAARKRHWEARRHELPWAIGLIVVSLVAGLMLMVRWHFKWAWLVLVPGALAAIAAFQVYVLDSVSISALFPSSVKTVNRRLLDQGSDAVWNETQFRQVPWARYVEPPAPRLFVSSSEDRSR